MFLASLLAMLSYGMLHSLLAAIGFKARARQLMGDRAFEGFYRLLYNIISTITLAPIALILFAVPAQVLWSVPAPWIGALVGIQAIVIICFILAVLQTDSLRFAGIRQALAYLRGDALPLPPEVLQTGGFYGLVRHPLYLFSLLALWSMPTMTNTYLGFAISATLYLILGSLMEERKMARAFPDYEAYRRRVPWLLPWPRP